MDDASATVDAVEAVHDDGHHDHPTDKKYVQVFLVLFVITAIEVAWLYLGLPSWALVGGLFAMMAVKFYLICSVFMHLNIDIKMFTQLFVTGLILATGVYLIMLSVMNFWDGF